MFAIIDIETCGGKFEFRKGRIIDICIVLHDGLQVTDCFSTLINPECYISPMYTNISGITNEMVADAPRFHEVASKIQELTSDRIFVAHNVGFDYGFVRDEFASLGFKYKRETLCTVRMSRKLLPGKMSYSLGKLCDSLGIENKARHRAEGDALATATLFERLLALKSLHPQYKTVGVDELMARRIDKMKKYILDQIPESTGVYYFLDKEGQIIYIGKSTNMYQRAVSHFSSKESKSARMLHELWQVKCTETGSELAALLLEASEIKAFKPKYNRMRKADTFSHSVCFFTNLDGVYCLGIFAEGSEKGQVLRSFLTYSAAREQLEYWIAEQQLCMHFCGLSVSEGPCFNFQIEKCFGICCQSESVIAYNSRVQKITERYVFKPSHFFILDQGRRADEVCLIEVRQGRFRGIGYISNEETYMDAHDLSNQIEAYIWYPDADDLIRSYLNRKIKSVKILKVPDVAAEDFGLI